MFKNSNLIRRVLIRQSGGILPIAAAFVTACVIILGAAIWFFYLAINKTQLQNIVNSASLAAIEGFIEGEGGSDLTNEFYLKAENGKARAAQILRENSGTLRGFSSQLGNIEFASAAAPFVPSPTHDKGGAITFGRWFPTEPTDAATVAPVCNARPDNEHRYPCFEPNSAVPASGVMRGADAVKVEACNENPITAPFSGEKQYVCEKSVASLVQRCVAFLVDLTMSQTYDSHKSLAEIVEFYDPLNLTPTIPTNPTAIPVIVKPLVDQLQPWHPVNNPSLASLAYFHDTVVGPLIADPSRCLNAATFRTADRLEAMLWCGMPNVRAGSSLPTQSTLHYKSDYRLRDYPIPNTNPKQWQQVWADVFASSDGSYVGPQPGTTVFGAINAALRSLEKNKTSGDRVMMLTFNRSIVSVIPEPAQGMMSDLGYLIQLTNTENRGTIDENTAATADGTQVHPNFLDNGWIPVLDGDSGKTNAALALDYTAEVMKQKCPATSVRSIVIFTDGLANCARHYVDAAHPAVNINPLYSSYLPNNYQYSCYNGGAMDQINKLAQFGNQLSGTAPNYINDWKAHPSIATALKQNSIAMTVVLAGDTVAPNTLEVPVPGSSPTRFYNQDELSALGWGGRVDSQWNSLFKITDSFARFPVGSYPANSTFGWIVWAGLNIPKAGYYYGAPNQIWAGTVMDSGGTFCPIRPKCRKDGDLMKQPPCNNNCPAGSEYIQDPSNTTPGAPRILNPLCLVNNPAAADPYSGCAKNDPGGVSNSRGLTCTYYDRTESEQAADCAVKTVSGNPYILVAQDMD